MGGGAAHGRCRHAQRAALHRRAAERARRSERRRPDAAHTQYNVVTDAVFHAPMFALNVDAPMNACAPSRPWCSADGRCSHSSAPLQVRPDPLAHARAHMSAAHARVCGARTHR
jgi:hypothetical protein